MKDGQIILIGIVVVAVLLSPALRRVAARAFVASVVFRLVSAIWRGRW